MALITTHEITTAGTAPTFDPAAQDDTAETGSRTFLVVKNANASTTRQVTVVAPGNLETGDAYPDKVYTVPISGEIWAPLLAVYRDPTTGQAQLDYDDTSDLTRAVVRI